MKEISVIIPVYNNPKELRLTLDSICAQNFPLEKLEVLICDDGSYLDMKSVAEEYTDRFSVRYFWQEDRGFRPGTARNMGILAAKGKLCAFFDSGVILLSDCIEKHIELHSIAGDSATVIGYIYGNDIHSDLKKMKEIIDENTPDMAAVIMERMGMVESRENLYNEFGDDLSEWPAPWVALWSLHFSVATEFLKKNDILFDSFFTTWGCEDNDFAIQLYHHNAKFLLGRSTRAIHYPAEIRSYDKLKNDAVFRENFHRNQEYVVSKYPDDRSVKLWNDKGYREVNRILLQERNKSGNR